MPRLIALKSLVFPGLPKVVESGETFSHENEAVVKHLLDSGLAKLAAAPAPVVARPAPAQPHRAPAAAPVAAQAKPPIQPTLPNEGVPK